MQHPDFAVLTVSWELALRADGYAANTVKAYQNAVRSLADWLAELHPDVGPAELDRQHALDPELILVTDLLGTNPHYVPRESDAVDARWTLLGPSS